MTAIIVAEALVLKQFPTDRSTDCGKCVAVWFAAVAAEKLIMANGAALHRMLMIHAVAMASLAAQRNVHRSAGLVASYYQGSMANDFAIRAAFPPTPAVAIRVAIPAAMVDVMADVMVVVPKWERSSNQTDLSRANRPQCKPAPAAAIVRAVQKDLPDRPSRFDSTPQRLNRCQAVDLSELHNEWTHPSEPIANY